MLLRSFFFLVAFSLIVPLQGHAQQGESADSSRVDTTSMISARPMGEVVVTATRSKQELENVAVPTSVLTDGEIDAQGAVRLADLLADQPGLQLSHDHGTGLQVQGLEADYTKILVDGEPIIGRTSGTLELNRLTVANVKRVEVVRGPSSSLYGSDALAGVVNVITQNPQRDLSAEVRTRYGTHQATNFSTQVEGGRGPVRGQLFLDRFSSAGYDLAPATVSPTTPSFTDYTGQGAFSVDAGERTTLSLRGRAATQQQESVAQVTSKSGLFDRKARRTDWNVAPQIEHYLQPDLKLSATLYGSGYHTETSLTRRSDGATYSESRYDQRYGKAETELQAVISERHLVTAGAGFIRESVDADRVNGTRNGGFVFAQDKWQATSWLDVTPSARLDMHSDYATRLSPKIAARADALSWLDVRASVGSGYKAPAFRQLYLDFTNPQVGYSVFGAQGVQSELRRLDEQDQIDAFLRNVESLGGPIEAESSVAFNVGTTVEPLDWLSARVNVFHNEISNLIDTQPVARKSNGQQVFTYFNLSEVYTRGLESEVTLRPLEALRATLSYTYLSAKDRQVLEQLEADRIYRRTAAGRDVPVTKSDYGGLVGRSRHRATAQLTYDAPLDLTISARGRYRGRYGFSDVNGNGIIDTNDEYAPGYTVLDLTLTKTLFEEYALQVGADNLTDHVDAAHTSFLSGRRWFAGLRLNF